MNPVIEAIRRRRSVRTFDPKPVPRDAVKAIIDAGNWATTGMNRQPWRFVVVEKSAFKKRLLMTAHPQWKKTVEGKRRSADNYTREYLTGLLSRSFGWHGEFDELMHRYVQMEDGVFYSAPVIVFVIGLNKGTRNADCAMVCQNMMLAAYSLGLGSCYVSSGAKVINDEEIVSILDLKEDEKIFGPIIFGYPKAGFPKPPRKNNPEITWIS